MLLGSEQEKISAKLIVLFLVRLSKHKHLLVYQKKLNYCLDVPVLLLSLSVENLENLNHTESWIHSTNP